MSNYNTGNPVPSIDPRDLDDNATHFDDLLNTAAPSVTDRTGVPRKTWWQIEQDALALISPNISALAGLSGAADKLPYFTGAGVMALATLTAAARTVLDDTTVAAMLATMGGAPLASPTFTGIPAGPTAAPGVNTTQFATTAFVEAARVILAAADALKAPLASPALTGTPLSPTPAVGTNTTQIATAAMLQAEIANKRTWTAYTPTITTGSGAFTTASATGKYMVAHGICHWQATLTVTTRGTGATAVISLPFAALSGSDGMPMAAKERAVNFKVGAAVINPANLGNVILYDYLGGDIITANGCIVSAAGSYPIA